MKSYPHLLNIEPTQVGGSDALDVNNAARKLIRSSSIWRRSSGGAGRNCPMRRLLLASSKTRPMPRWPRRRIVVLRRLQATPFQGDRYSRRARGCGTRREMQAGWLILFTSGTAPSRKVVRRGPNNNTDSQRGSSSWRLAPFSPRSRRNLVRITRWELVFRRQLLN